MYANFQQIWDTRIVIKSMKWCCTNHLWKLQSTPKCDQYDDKLEEESNYVPYAPKNYSLLLLTSSGQSCINGRNKDKLHSGHHSNSSKHKSGSCSEEKEITEKVRHRRK